MTEAAAAVEICRHIGVRTRGEETIAHKICHRNLVVGEEAVGDHHRRRPVKGKLMSEFRLEMSLGSHDLQGCVKRTSSESATGGAGRTAIVALGRGAAAALGRGAASSSSSLHPDDANVSFLNPLIWPCSAACIVWLVSNFDKSTSIYFFSRSAPTLVFPPS